MTPALALLQLFSKSRNALLQPKTNPLLHYILKRTLYNHFCAGENHGEVTSTIRRIKAMGFRGVILTYAKEVVVDSSQSQVGTGTQQLEEAKQADVDVSPHHDKDIQAWRDGVLETVAMLSKGDFLALKYGDLALFFNNWTMLTLTVRKLTVHVRTDSPAQAQAWPKPCRPANPCPRRCPRPSRRSASRPSGAGP